MRMDEQILQTYSITEMNMRHLMDAERLDVPCKSLPIQIFVVYFLIFVAKLVMAEFS